MSPTVLNCGLGISDCGFSEFDVCEKSTIGNRGNVFVTGTGRCGTVAFARACGHIENYTAAHETKAGSIDSGRWEYPTGHIEIDPHLAWTLGEIVGRYRAAFYVHLQRRREEVVASWHGRGIGRHSGAAPLIDVICQTVCTRLTEPRYRAALGLLYDVVNSNIALALAPLSSMHIWLHDVEAGFQRFWSAIGAEGDFEAALAEFDRRHNATLISD